MTSKEENMLEKCARAIWTERVRHAAEQGIRLEAFDDAVGFRAPEFGEPTVAALNNVFGEARAIIEALMEPTPGMVEIGASSVRWHRGAVNGAKGAYREMLQSILQSKEEGEGR